MRIVPQAPLSMPPMTQPGHGLPDGPLADLNAKLAASGSNTFAQDHATGLSGTIPQVSALQQTSRTLERLCAMCVMQEARCTSKSSNQLHFPSSAVSAFHAPQDLPGIGAPTSLQLSALGGPNFLPGIAFGGPAGLGPPMGAVSNGVRTSPSQGDLRQLWQMVTQVCTDTSSCHLHPTLLVASGQSTNAAGPIGTSIADCMCSSMECAFTHVAM